jgi:hypothetical protein
MNKNFSPSKELDELLNQKENELKDIQNMKI